MSEIRIKTLRPKNFGQKLLFGTTEIEFDRKGESVQMFNTERANDIVRNYEGWLYIGEREITAVKPDKAVEEEFAALQAKLDAALNKLEVREGTLKSLQQEVNNWKEQVEKLKKENEALSSDSDNELIVAKNVIKDLELKLELNNKKINELQDMCVTLNIPEDKYKQLTKAAIIDLIVSESK